MSDGASPRRKPRLLAAMGVGASILLALVGYFILHDPYGPKEDRKVTGPREENFLAQARTQLAKHTDLTSTRTAVQFLNSHLQKAAEQPPPLTDAAATRLRDQLGLTPEEAAEVASASFTPLDAHYLESCFLFRDAARSLEASPLNAPGGKTVRPTPLDHAVAGFDWVVREVRLSDSVEASEQAPPAAILRRGIGSAHQRAQVFLALLEQFGLDEADAPKLRGCLVYCPDEKGGRRLWACGVAVGNEPGSLYLFDPRVGLAIPGPAGRGVATLALAQSDPSVLAQWKIDKLSYDVTPARAKDATTLIIVPLSAAAPRMRFLQDRLLRDRDLNGQPLPAPIRVRLAEDPDRALAAVRAGLGKAEAVQVWREGTGVLRRFLPTTEGGADRATTGRLPAQVRFQFNGLPWGEFPAILNETDRLGADLSQRLRMAYALPFLRPFLDANSSRELLLRGRFEPAVRDLVREQEQLQQSRNRIRQATDLEVEVDRWLVEKARRAYAELIQARGTANEAAANAQVEQLWRWKLGDPIEVLLNGSVAGPRGAEVMYQLALCRHEQATRLQQRADLAATAGLSRPAGTDKAQATWLEAEGFWKEFLDNNPGRPGIASAQRLRAEAQARLGRKSEAVKLWRDLSAPQTDLERIARLWLAR